MTEFLYSGEQFDAKIGQQYLRARYYDPATGRFNRLDPFLGNLDDPQSFHKYLYCHADPVNGVDPAGHFLVCVMLVSGLQTHLRTKDTEVKSGVGAHTTSRLVAETTAYQNQLVPLTLNLGLDVYITYRLAQFIWSESDKELLTQTATRFGTEVATTTSITKKIRENEDKYFFYHGTSTGRWTDTYTIGIPPINPNHNLDFGPGFYTYSAATPDGYFYASDMAARSAQAQYGGGLGFVILLSVPKFVYDNEFGVKDYGNWRSPTDDYSLHVNMYRNGGDPNLGYSYDVITGPVAKYTSVEWVARPNFPEQYAFKTEFAVSNLTPVAILPAISYILA